MALPSNVTTGTVVGRLLDLTGQPYKGRVVFDATPEKLANVTSVPKTVFLPDTESAVIDDDGDIVKELVSTDNEAFNPKDWTWRARFVLTNGKVVNSFHFKLPAGAVVDLADIMPVTSSNGVPILASTSDADLAGIISDPESATRAVVEDLASGGGLTPAPDASFLQSAAAQPGRALPTVDTTTGQMPAVVEGRIGGLVGANAISRARSDRLRADGDSFTANGSSSADSWALKLGADLGMSVYRNGNSGECSGGVAIKAGAIQVTLALGTSTVTAGSGTLTGTYGTDITPCNVRKGVLSVPGRLVGTNGQVTGTFSVATDGAAVFAYSGLASSVTISSTAAQFIADGSSDHRDESQVVWVGRNDVAFSWPTHASGSVAAVRAIINHTRTSVKRAIVASVCTSSTEGASTGTSGTPRGRVLEINAALKAAFPDFYYDIRRDLIDHGLDLAGITPTSGDLADIADDTVPRSLLGDGLHPNTAGRMVIAQLFKAELDRRGGVGTEPVAVLTPAQGTRVNYLIAANPQRYAPDPRYYTPAYASKANASIPAGELRLAPFRLDRPMTLKGTAAQLGLRVSTAAAGSSIKVGLYASDQYGLPGALILDAGTLDATSTGTKWCNSAATGLPAGIYWIGALALGGAPTVMQGSGATDVAIGHTNVASLIDGAAPGGYQGGTGLAALPASIATPVPAAAAPVFAVILQEMA